MSGKRVCSNCIHRDACQDWVRFPIGDKIDTSCCRFYEEEKNCSAYALGHADAVRELARDVNRPCTHGEGVTVRPDGVHELSPHAYTLIQRLRNVTVEILTCETCGDVSVAWYRQDDTEEV